MSINTLASGTSPPSATSASHSHPYPATTTTPSTSSTTAPLTITASTTPNTHSPSATTKAVQLPLPIPLPSPPHATITPSTTHRITLLPALPTPTNPTSSSPETEHQLLDRWAFALANWVIPRWDRPIRELDGWRTVCGMHGGFVRDCSLSVFVLLGAAEEIPFSVYRELDMGNEETIEPAVAWMRDLRARRMLHEVLTPQLLQDVSPLPCV